VLEKRGDRRFSLSMGRVLGLSFARDDAQRY
jgi:hypothetical protein